MNKIFIVCSVANGQEYDCHEVEAENLAGAKDEALEQANLVVRDKEKNENNSRT